MTTIAEQIIEDTLDLQAILNPIWTDEAPPLSNVIASLIEWADHRNHVHVAPDSEQPIEVSPPVGKAKRGKATESDDSDSRVTPDPTDEPDF